MAETELWAKCGEIGDGDCRGEVEEDNGEGCGSEVEAKYGRGEGPKGEGCYRGVGAQPHPHAVGQAVGVIPVIGGYSFDPSSLNTI